MQINFTCRYLFVILLLLFQGCATNGLNQQIAGFQRPPEAIHFFEVLDRIIDEAELRNAANFAVSGFPYLRTNRFLTGLKPDFIATVQAAVTNFEEYRTAYRVMGLYPITSMPVAYVTHRVQTRFRRWHHTPVDQLAIQGERIEYLIFFPWEFRMRAVCANVGTTPLSWLGV